MLSEYSKIVIHFLASFRLAAALSPSPPFPQYPFDLEVGGRTAFKPGPPDIRNATYSDLPSIITTFIDAFSPAPISHYLYQFASEHPKYHEYCINKRVANGIAPAVENDGVTLKVIAVPDRDGESDRVVSVAVWLFTNANEDNISTLNRLSLSRLMTPSFRPSNTDEITQAKHHYNCSTFIDANVTRAAHVAEQEDKLTETYLKPYAPYLYLALLATHPDFDGHGYAAAQIKLGQSWAAERGIPVTLLATPSGYPVYQSLGFRGLKNATLSFEEDMVVGCWEEAMVWDGEM